MAVVQGAMFSVYCRGKFGGVLVYQYSKGRQVVMKKRVHTGRLKPHEIAFRDQVRFMARIRQSRFLRPVVFVDELLTFDKERR